MRTPLAADPSATPRGRILVALAAVLALSVGCTSSPGDAGASEPDPGGTGGALGSPRAPGSSTPPPAPVPTAGGSWDRGIIDLADGAPTAWRGVWAAPEDPGQQRGVAVVLHGNHPTCANDASEWGTWPCPQGTELRNEEGLGWLVEALAGQGFVAVAPGVNVQYTLGAGEPQPAVRTAEIVTRTIEALRAGDLAVEVQPAADRLVLVGHSVGGQDASILASGQAGFALDVAGLVLLQPAINAAEALPLPDVPATVVVTQCDGDVGLTGGIFLSERVLLQRSQPTALLALDAGTHNATNELLGPDFAPVETPDCVERPEGEERDRQDRLQRELFAEIVPGAALAALGEEAGGWAAQVFEEPATPEGVHLTVVPPDARVAPYPGTDAAATQAVTTQDVELTFCPTGYYTPWSDPGTEPCHRPELPSMVGQPSSLAVAWSAEGAQVTLPVEGRSGEVLRLRAFADPADTSLGEGPIVLRLRADDGSTSEVTIPVPAALRFESEPFQLAGAFLPWQTFTWELGADLSELTIEFVAPEAGALQLVSLGVD